MPEVKPSAGAMRAAQRIYEVAGGVDLDQWAAIIESEMGQIQSSPFQQDCADLREALTGLLALSEKMFDLLQVAVDRGVASFRPPDVTFDKLKFVVMSRAVLAPTAPKGDGKSAVVRVG